MNKKSPAKLAKRTSESSAKKAKPADSKPTGTQSQTTAGSPVKIEPSELQQLVSLRHSDPHRILGPHLSEAGVTIRAFRPDAESLKLIVGTKRPQPMTKTYAAGLFEILLPDLTSVPSYRFTVQEPGGELVTLRDPYSFAPTLGELDLHLFGEGRHEAIYENLGAHVRKVGRVNGVSFAVWAPHAEGVSVVGTFNGWNGQLNQMRMLGGSGVWELFIPDLEPGTMYKYEIRARGWRPFLKADPYAVLMEVPPNTSSIVYQSTYKFHDQKWLAKRAKREHFRQPLSIYEVHFGSWRRVLEEDNRPFQYRALAPVLADYALDLGFTHVEFLPLKEHPYGPSWGYQVGSYYAASARYGTPDDLRYLIDHLHQRGIGVIMDWVPAHFPKDAFALGRFDGSALYEHLDSRKGEHPDWGTYIFNYGRNEVRNFLMANALYWLKEFHLDGLRVDAVASMLYLDYSRKEGEWVPNQFGGRENLEALALLKELNEVTHRECPGVMMIAEESTAWPQVSHPVYAGGLGFDFKWNMGWMHDSLEYMQEDPVNRRYHHDKLTFGLIYAFNENFILPLSHDEVVHGKGSLIDKMPGDEWRKFANLRAYYGFMYAHPGKSLLFMGGELAQNREWNHDTQLDWDLLQDPKNAGIQRLVKDLNAVYAGTPALYEVDFEEAGFEWIEGGDSEQSVVSFLRRAKDPNDHVLVVCNFTPVVREGYRVGVPGEATYEEALNTDANEYGGSGVTNTGPVSSENISSNGREHSIELTLPPLAVTILKPTGDRSGISG